jgi:hypothetical protein
MDLIPKEKIDELVDKEINAFFETEQLLTVEVTKVEVDNPNYEPSRGYGYNNEKKITREAIAFGSKMTPFRQLVWTELHQHLQPKIKALLTAEDSKVKAEMDKWVNQSAAPVLHENYQSMFTHLAMGMSNMMLHRMMRDAATTAHANMAMALSSVGLPTGNLPQPMVAPITPGL